MSEMLKVVFAAFMQHCIRSNVTHVTHVRGVEGVLYSVYYRAPNPPRVKAIWKAFHLVGLVVHHQSVWGGSLVNFLGLVKLQGWLQERCTANSQFLKLRGAQQPGNSYTSMGTKLHPPYPNQDCLPVQILTQKVLFNAWRMAACEVVLALVVQSCI